MSEEDARLEADRRVQTYLKDFRGAATIDVAKLRGEATAALAREVNERRTPRSRELRQQIADTLDRGTQDLQRRYDARRAVPLPVITDPATAKDAASAQLLATRRLEDSNLQIAASMQVTDRTSDEELLRRMSTPGGNPHAQHRAEELLRARLPAIKAQAAVDRASGNRAAAERAQHIAEQFETVVAARVPPLVKAAEQAEQRAWQVFGQAAQRIVTLLNVNERVGVAMTAPMVARALAADVVEKMHTAREDLRKAWGPVASEVRKARLARTAASVRG